MLRHEYSHQLPAEFIAQATRSALVIVGQSALVWQGRCGQLGPCSLPVQFESAAIWHTLDAHTQAPGPLAAHCAAPMHSTQV
jgi:hypothetical protein